MAKQLLSYFFPITANDPTPAASTAFLKQVCILVAPKSGVTVDVVTLCTSMTAVAALTNNIEAQQLFNAGMNRVYVLPVNDLDVAAVMAAEGSDFYTVLVSSDFADAAIDPSAATGTITITSYANLISGTADVITINGTAFTAQAGAATLGTGTFRAYTSNDLTAASLVAQINGHATVSLAVVASAVAAVVTITSQNTGSSGNDLTLGYTDNDVNVGATKSGTTLTGGDGLFLGTFGGVVGMSSTDDAKLATYATTPKWAPFHTTTGNKAKNMFYAFGKLLANPLDWLNQQYISMPLADDVDSLGDSEALFDDKINFVMTDDEFGKRLGLFAAGGKAIVAPYIIRNLEIDMQSKALAYVSGNMPGYTHTQAALLEDELQKIISGTPDVPGYVQKGWLVSGTVEVKLEQDNYIASGYIDIPTPRALWRIFGSLTQT